MSWEFLIALLMTLLGLSVSIVILHNRPVISLLLIIGAWAELIAAVLWLERRDRDEENSK